MAGVLVPIAVAASACSSGGPSGPIGDAGRDRPASTAAPAGSPIAPSLAVVSEGSLAPCAKAGFDGEMKFSSGSATHDTGNGVRYNAEIMSVKPLSDSSASVVIARCDFIGASGQSSTWLGIVSGDAGNLKIQGQPAEIDSTIRAEMFGDEVQVLSEEYAEADAACCSSATDLDTYVPSEDGFMHLNPTFRTYDDAVVGDSEQASILCDELQGVSDEQWSELSSGIDYLSVGRGAAGGVVVTRMINPPDADVVDSVRWFDGKFDTTIEVVEDYPAVLFVDYDGGEKVCAAPTGPGD